MLEITKLGYHYHIYFYWKLGFYKIFFERFTPLDRIFFKTLGFDKFETKEPLFKNTIIGTNVSETIYIEKIHYTVGLYFFRIGIEKIVDK